MYYFLWFFFRQSNTEKSNEQRKKNLRHVGSVCSANKRMLWVQSFSLSPPIPKFERFTTHTKENSRKTIFLCRLFSFFWFRIIQIKSFIIVVLVYIFLLMVFCHFYFYFYCVCHDITLIFGFLKPNTVHVKSIYTT